ncbi:hypothetical protein EJ02DRAFT_334696, partial [Clathrospora elynae]
YMCLDCEADVLICGGAGIYDQYSGANTDRVRCRECGCRILMKQRTQKMVRFEER